MSLVGLALLWIGIAQLDGAFVRETGVAAGKVARVVPGQRNYAIEIAGQGGRFEMLTSTLPHPTAQALSDASSVVVTYDTRPLKANAHAIVGLSVDGRAYFSPGTYQVFGGLWALVVLVPGATLFGFGVSALLRAFREDGQSSDLAPEVAAALPGPALIIPFPRRQS